MFLDSVLLFTIAYNKLAGPGDSRVSTLPILPEVCRGYRCLLSHPSFTQVLGTGTLVLALIQQVPCPPRHLPPPHILSLKEQEQQRGTYFLRCLYHQFPNHLLVVHEAELCQALDC